MSILRLTFTAGGRSCSLSLDPASSLEDVAAILEAELGLPSSSMVLTLGARSGGASPAALSTLGAADGDTIVVTQRVAAGPRSRARSGSAARLDPATYSSLSFDSLPPGVTAQQLWEILRVNAGMRAEVSPDMAAAAQEPTSDRFKRLYLRSVLDRSLPEAQRAGRLAQAEARLRTDPFDREAQVVLAEEIERRNVEANLEAAYEHMPESFTRCVGEEGVGEGGHWRALPCAPRSTRAPLPTPPSQRAHALRGRRHQQRQGQGLRGLGCADDHHEPRLRRALRPAAAAGHQLQWDGRGRGQRAHFRQGAHGAHGAFECPCSCERAK